MCLARGPRHQADFSASTTFRFVVAGHRRHVDWPSQQRVIDQLLDCPGLPFGTTGKVDLKAAKRVFRVLIVYSDDTEAAHVVCVYLLEEVRPRPATQRERAMFGGTARGQRDWGSATVGPRMASYPPRRDFR